MVDSAEGFAVPAFSSVVRAYGWGMFLESPLENGMSGMKAGQGKPFDGEAAKKRQEEILRRLADPELSLSDAERAEMEKEALLLSMEGSDKRRGRMILKVDPTF